MLGRYNVGYDDDLKTKAINITVLTFIQIVQVL